MGKWSQTEIIAKLQDKDSLYKHLLARVGAEDSNYKISSDQKSNYPKRISNFTHCHQIYKILECDTKNFDSDFSELASNEYIKITTKLNANKSGNGLNEIFNKTKKKKQPSRAAFKRQMMQKTNKNLYGEGRKNLFKLLTKFIEKHLKPMKELPMNEVFVYSKATKFCLDMFPPTNKQIRDRYEKHEDYFGDTNDIEAEA